MTSCRRAVPAPRAALRQLPPVGENSFGSLGPGLLASGLLGTIIRELQARLADPDHALPRGSQADQEDRKDIGAAGGGARYGAPRLALPDRHSPPGSRLAATPLHRFRYGADALANRKELVRLIQSMCARLAVRRAVRTESSCARATEERVRHARAQLLQTFDLTSSLSPTRVTKHY
jgi:hypothetical protein